MQFLHDDRIDCLIAITKTSHPFLGQAHRPVPTSDGRKKCFPHPQPSPSGRGRMAVLTCNASCYVFYNIYSRFIA